MSEGPYHLPINFQGLYLFGLPEHHSYIRQVYEQLAQRKNRLYLWYAKKEESSEVIFERK